jgi:hypothetical protein
MLDEAKRRRAMRPEVRTTREALALVRPMYREINFWHTRTAHLIAMAQTMHGRKVRKSDFLEEAKALSQQVDRTRLAFRLQMAALPSSVASCSRIVDVKRSLDSISAGLDRAVGLFQPD